MGPIDEAKRAVRRDKVIVYKDRSDRWRWHRRSGWNNQTIATSHQGYSNKSHAVRMAKRINRRSILIVEG